MTVEELRNMLLIFGILVSAGIAAFVLSFRKYNHKEAERRAKGLPEFPEAEELAGHGSASGKSDRGAGDVSVHLLMGVDGYFRGRSFTLGRSAVIFGRDALKCNAVYPSGTKGVSGLHCRVELTGGRILLTDLESTYGTFLQNGQKLAAHQPKELRSGERFYLASQTNMFQVR